MSNQMKELMTSTNSSKIKEKTPAFQTQRIFEITGKQKKHLPPQNSHEIKKFNRIKLKNFPNSNRVLIPEENRETQKKKIHSNSTHRFNSESTQFAYISNVDYNIKKKPMSPYGRETFSFKQEEATKNNNFTSLKRGNRQTPYGNYSTTTQIVNLPGGVKRNDNEIKDDRKTSRPVSRGEEKQRESYKAKIVNDYYTNISCLPGCPYNQKTVYKEDIPLRKQFNNRSQSDIFNLRKGDTNQYNNQEQGKRNNLLFNMSHKRIFPEKNNTTSENRQKCFKKDYYRNKSNFTFI